MCPGDHCFNCEQCQGSGQSCCGDCNGYGQIPLLYPILQANILSRISPTNTISAQPLFTHFNIFPLTLPQFLNNNY